MRRSVLFESPFPGSQADAYVGDDLVTFELVKSSSEVWGSGVTEFWGHRVVESYTRHHVEEATVVAVNEEPYDTSLHGRKEQFLAGVRLQIEARF